MLQIWEDCLPFMNPQVFFILESFSCSFIFLSFFLQSVIYFFLRFSYQGSLKHLRWPAAAQEFWRRWEGSTQLSVLEICRWILVDDMWANGGKLQDGVCCCVFSKRCFNPNVWYFGAALCSFGQAFTSQITVSLLLVHLNPGRYWIYFSKHRSLILRRYFSVMYMYNP